MSRTNGNISSTAVEPSSPLRPSSPVAAVSSDCTEMLIIVKDEDEDDDVNDLASRIGMLTMYAVNNAEVTPYWSTGAAAQRNGSRVRATGVRVRHYFKPTAWVVFIGVVPGVYHRWVDAEAQVDKQPRAVHIGYRSRRDASNAYSFALSKEWVASTLDTHHPLIRPKPTYNISLVRPKIHMISSSTPIGTGLARPAWQVVYVGIRPGVYDNFLQASLNVAGIPDSANESAPSRDAAIKLYLRAYGRGEIGTCTAVE